MMLSPQTLWQHSGRSFMWSIIKKKTKYPTFVIKPRGRKIKMSWTSRLLLTIIIIIGVENELMHFLFTFVDINTVTMQLIFHEFYMMRFKVSSYMAPGIPHFQLKSVRSSSSFSPRKRQRNSLDVRKFPLGLSPHSWHAVRGIQRSI